MGNVTVLCYTRESLEAGSFAVVAAWTEADGTTDGAAEDSTYKKKKAA